MSRVHIAMNGKGGINKTGTAVNITDWEIRGLLKAAGHESDKAIADHFDETKKGVVVKNADTENNTIGQYKSLVVSNVNLLKRQSSGELDIDKGNLDLLVEEIISEDRPIVIDVGTSAFRPFIAHLQAYGILKLLVDSGKEVFVHVVIGGGQHLKDTVKGALGIQEAADGSGAKLVVWNNGHFGETRFNIFDANGNAIKDVTGYDIEDLDIRTDPSGYDMADLLVDCIGSVTQKQASARDRDMLAHVVFQGRRMLIDTYTGTQCNHVERIVANRYYKESFDGLDAVAW